MAQETILAKPFWKRQFPQLYRCKNCGKYALMRKPEPWAGHLCNPPPQHATGMGEYELVAEGAMAAQLWADLKEEKKD